MTFPFPTFNPNKSPCTCTFLGSASTGSDQTIYAISSATIGNLGADDPTREIMFVVIGTGGATNIPLNSIQVGSPATTTGIVGTNQANSFGANREIAIATIPFPTGSVFPDNVYVTWNAETSGTFRLAWYRVTNRANRSVLTDSAHVFATGSGAATPSSLVIKGRGFGIGGMYTETNNTHVLTNGGAGWTIDAQESSESHNSSFFHSSVSSADISSNPGFTIGGSGTNYYWASWAIY